MKEMEILKRKRDDRRRREEKEWFGKKDDADEVRALASRLEEQEKEMERLKKNREDRKGIEKKEWFGRTSRVSFNTRSEGEMSLKKEVLGSFAMTFYGLIMRRS